MLCYAQTVEQTHDRWTISFSLLKWKLTYPNKPLLNIYNMLIYKRKRKRGKRIMKQSKENLFREMEEFGGAEPKEAVNTIIDFLGWINDSGTDIDERVSDAIKRLQTFVKEVDQVDPLGMFLDEEIKFRLKEIHGIENPSQELVDKINFDGLDDCEGYLDNEYIDNVIREQIELYNKEKKEE